MPTYDYHCDNCNHEFEKFQSIKSSSLKKCPKCKKLKLRRLQIPAYSKNVASNAVAKSLGFTFEGKLRKAIICKATGKIHDENLWGLLKEEWEKSLKI